MINNLVLVGRLTKDPELKYTSSNNAFCNFIVAVSRNYQASPGQVDTDFINCIAWRQTAENLCKFMKKGSLIGIEGRIQSRSYDDQTTGQRRYITEVVCDNVRFLEPRKQGEGQSYNQGNQNFGQNQNYNSGQNYGQNQGYNSNQNFGQGQSYNQNQGYSQPSPSVNPFEPKQYTTPIKEEPQDNGNPFNTNIDIDGNDDLPF